MQAKQQSGGISKTIRHPPSDALCCCPSTRPMKVVSGRSRMQNFHARHQTHCNALYPPNMMPKHRGIRCTVREPS